MRRTVNISVTGCISIAVCFVLVLNACTDKQSIESSDYLSAAIEVGNWLIAQDDADGHIPDKLAGSVSSPSLGSGAAGRALFFLELFYATRDSSYLAWAQSESEILISLKPSDPGGEDFSPGLYNGAAGIVFSLSAMHRATSDEQYRSALLKWLPFLADSTLDEDINDVIAGIAGIGLALLKVADYDSSVINTAAVMGDTLLARGIPTQNGMYWMRAETMEFNLPNFSHGTAGIGFFLGRLYQVTGQNRFLEGAEMAARYLMDVANTDNELFLVPYGIPNDGYATPFDIGWAHGPAGTARLFHLLAEMTGDELYDAIVDANVKSLIASGIPGSSLDSLRWVGPFGIDQRFGTSGAAQFLLKQHRTRRDTSAFRLGWTLVDDILDRSVVSTDGRYWQLPKYGFQGDGGAPASFTGYFYGAAGLGLAVLDMHYAEIGTAPTIVFPDDVGI